MDASSLPEFPQSMPLDSVELGPEALKRVLDWMDAQTCDDKCSRRRHERLNYRCKGLIVTIDQNGYTSTLAVPVRNISNGGISFLHRAMIHPGSPCVLHIRTPAGEWMQADGKVVRTRYVKTGVYEIGLAFDREIDVTPFKVPAAAPPTTADPKPPV